MNPRSIRFRLTAWYALILAATFAVMGIGVWLAIRHSIDDTADKDLRARLELMRDYLSHLEGGQAGIAAELNEDSALAPAGTQFRIADASGNWIYRSPEAAKWTLAMPGAASLPKRGRTETVEVNGKHVRVLSAPVQAGAIQMGAPVEAFYDMLEDLTWSVLLAIPLVLLMASAGGYWMSRRALQPVDRIGRMAREISAHNMSERLPLRGSADELDRLSAALNGMFARLEESFQRITQFTADASHELRTPVAIIRTTAEIALSRPRSSEEHAKSWALVLAESERTSSLIDDLMTLARADAGSGNIALEPMDLAESVREACEEARVLAQSAGLRFDARLPDACPISGDSDGLRRLILALLDNAIKFTPAGGEVAVSMEVVTGTAVVEVRDTGVGIGAEEQARIFDRFYRVSKDRSRMQGGAGLGLSIAQWLARWHGGGIEVESAVGVGSVFRVRLPVGGS